MGHILLGPMPRTKPWMEVVTLIAAGADVSQVGNATISAAEKAFAFVLNDKGFTEAAWIMTQLGVAAKKPDILAHLRSAGLLLPPDANLIDLSTAIYELLDRRAYSSTERSDLGELASRALVRGINDVMANKVTSLFYDPETLKAGLATLGKINEFGNLSRRFFTRLIYASLDYFLSKTLDTHVGEGMRFPTQNQLAQFNSALETHCWETSLIVEKYSRDWFSKHKFEGKGDISRKESDGFASFALKKITDELKMGVTGNER